MYMYYSNLTWIHRLHGFIYYVAGCSNLPIHDQGGRKKDDVMDVVVQEMVLRGNF